MDWFTPENLALAAGAFIAIASLLSSILPDDSGLMRIVNLIALNVGKAKNDPGAQR